MKWLKWRKRRKAIEQMATPWKDDAWCLPSATRLENTLPDDAGHPVTGVLEVVQYQDGLRRIHLTGRIERDRVMKELKAYLYRDERIGEVNEP